jgi:hypothetical protein
VGQIVKRERPSSTKGEDQSIPDVLTFSTHMSFNTVSQSQPWISTAAGHKSCKVHCKLFQSPQRRPRQISATAGLQWCNHYSTLVTSRRWPKMMGTSILLVGRRRALFYTGANVFEDSGCWLLGIMWALQCLFCTNCEGSLCEVVTLLRPIASKSAKSAKFCIRWELYGK